MREILNGLIAGQVLHTTSRGTHYRFLSLSADGGVIYSINAEQKTIPLQTILDAEQDFNTGVAINKDWYRRYNETESRSRPCNLSVINNLLNWLHDEE